jgi:hypothetical protein
MQLVPSMRVRPSLFALALAAVIAGLALSTSAAAGDGAPTTCRAVKWCTITAAGEASSIAAQYAIGNVRRGTELAITQDYVSQRQVGGEILSGVMAGVCAWSQYQRDWAPLVLTPVPDCADPQLTTDQFVADNGTAVWTGCYPRCFGGVPLRYDPRCGRHGRRFCYSSNCEEYGNYSPWSPSAHPTDPLRMTGRHRLDVRYLARFGDVWTNSPFYMVRDGTVGHGRGDWVFVSGAACHIVTGPIGTYRRPPKHQ